MTRVSEPGAAWPSGVINSGSTAGGALIRKKDLTVPLVWKRAYVFVLIPFRLCILFSVYIVSLGLVSFLQESYSDGRITCTFLFRDFMYIISTLVYLYNCFYTR